MPVVLRRPLTNTFDRHTHTERHVKTIQSNIITLFLKWEQKEIVTIFWIIKSFYTFKSMGNYILLKYLAKLYYSVLLIASVTKCYASVALCLFLYRVRAFWDCMESHIDQKEEISIRIMLASQVFMQFLESFKSSNSQNIHL